jgi:hypothetical protein
MEKIDEELEKDPVDTEGIINGYIEEMKKQKRFDGTLHLQYTWKKASH